MIADNIHQGQPILQLGDEAAEASLHIIALHGRGATAESMKPLAEALYMPGLRFHIPQAARDYWYPQSAFAPIELNQPDLDSALTLIEQTVEDLHQMGADDRNIAIGGFSQGACLAAEYAVRHPANYAGLFVFSGALIGPEDSPREYPGSFQGMPVFIGGSDVDPWVPHHLLVQTAEVLESMDASVDFQTYPAMGHTVNQDEIERVRRMFSTQLVDMADE